MVLYVTFIIEIRILKYYCLEKKLKDLLKNENLYLKKLNRKV